MDDWRLLRQYLDDGSQAAFAQLVGRHMKIVYWTCRRDIPNDQLAEDVTQAVFVILARKAASLKPDVSIAGWLFATARHVCRRTVRGEERRRHYEQEAARSMEHVATQEAGWNQIEPWINDGLCRLGASDREAILLRYFDGLSLAEVAQATGTSEPAARKRVSRAVERLRHYFAQKEVTMTSAVLLALLAERSAKAAPVDYQAIALQAVQASSPPTPAPHLAYINPLLAKGLILVSTSKLIAGGIAAIVVILALTLMAVRHAHSTTTSGSSNQFGVTWQAVPPADNASQQAQQQIHAQLSQICDGEHSRNAQQILAVLSPDFTLTGGDLNGKVRSFTYSDEKAILPGLLANRYIRTLFTVTSCSMTGNTATLQTMSEWSHTTNPTPNHSFPITFTFVNTGGKWLMSRAQVVR